MKHHRLITRKPQLGQTTTDPQSNFQVFKTFVENLVDQAIEYAFIKTS